MFCVAPEVISNRRHYDGRSADVWSSGVLLYVMLFCQYPFERAADKTDSHRVQKILQRILNVDYEFPENRPVSPECRDLLSKILAADPAQRLSIQQVRQERHREKAYGGSNRVKRGCQSMVAGVILEELRLSLFVVMVPRWHSL